MEAARSELICLASRRLATGVLADEWVDVLAGQRPKIGNGQAPGTVTGRGAAGADAGLVAVNSVVAVAGFATGIPASGPFVAAPSIGPGAVFFGSDDRGPDARLGPGADGERVAVAFTFTVADGLTVPSFVAAPTVAFFATTFLAGVGLAPALLARVFPAAPFFATTFFAAGFFAVSFFAAAFCPTVRTTGFEDVADDRASGFFAALFATVFATVFAAAFVARFVVAGFAAGFAGRRDAVDREPVDALDADRGAAPVPLPRVGAGDFAGVARRPVARAGVAPLAVALPFAAFRAIADRSIQVNARTGRRAVNPRTGPRRSGTR